MRVCVRRPRQRPHSRCKATFRFRLRKTAKQPWRPRREPCRRLSMDEDELERELQTLLDDCLSDGGSLVSEEMDRFADLQMAVDPAAPSCFNPPLAALDTVQGCPRCRLIGAALAWHRAYDEPDYDGNSRVYILHRHEEDLEQGLLARCWWCVRISESLGKWNTGQNGRARARDRSTWPITFQFIGEDRHINIEAGTTSWWERFRAWKFPTSHRLPLPEIDGDARPGPVTIPGNHEHTGLCPGNVHLRPAQAALPSTCPTFSKKGLRLTGLEKLERNTDNPATWAYVKDRLQNCARNHVVCRGSDAWVPSRLVEVVTLESRVQFRLVLTSDWVRAKPYTTLSHRWGSNATFKLTEKTWDELQQGVSSEELPQKYIDAAQATRELGVEYIWIDSLCIIQDDPEDWRRESVQMHLVYRYSFCNLSAASSLSPDDGLFFNRDPNRVKPYILDHGRGKKRTLITQDGYDNFWFKKLDQEPLYGRAWVCQERLLATRNVSFTEYLVFFECGEELSCEVCDSRFRMSEGGGFRLGRERNASHKPLSLRTLGLRQDTVKTATTRDEDHATWRNIMAFYSRCGITFLTDKLLAVAGVARVFHDTLASEYVAGLWKDDILRDLAWMRRDEPEHENKEAAYVAPSWSWASLGSAPISYRERRGTYHPLAACEDVQTTPIGHDPFGQLASGFLRLRCYVIPLRCAPSHGNPDGPRRSAGEWRLDLEPELLYSLGCQSSDLEHRLDTYAPAALGTRYYAVPLYAVDDERTFEFCTAFLLLASLSPVEGRYRRVGLAEVATPARRKKPQDGQPEVKEAEIPGRWRSLGLAPRAYTLLQRMLKDIEKVEDVPAHDRGPDGRWLITII